MRWMFVVALAALVLLVGPFVVSAACGPTAAGYERESERILGDLPVYPGTHLVIVETARESCETFCWLTRNDYYSLATYSTATAEVGELTDCAAAGAVATYYLTNAAPEWKATRETYPMTWPGGREGCSMIVTMRRSGKLVYVNVNSTEFGGLGNITISISH